MAATHSQLTGRHVHVGWPVRCKRPQTRGRRCHITLAAVVMHALCRVPFVTAGSLAQLLLKLTPAPQSALLWRERETAGSPAQQPWLQTDLQYTNNTFRLQNEENVFSCSFADGAKK